MKILVSVVKGIKIIIRNINIVFFFFKIFYKYEVIRLIKIWKSSLFRYSFFFMYSVFVGDVFLVMIFM